VDLVKLGLPRIDLMMFGDKSEQVGVDNVAAAEKEEKLDDATREGQSSRFACRKWFFNFFFFYSLAGAASPVSASSVAASDVQRVKLSRKSCMINVESL